MIGFGAGEPDFPTPEHDRRGRRGGLPRPAQPPLHPDRRAAGAARRRSPRRPRATPATTSRPAQVLVTNGGKQAVYEAFATLLDPGDEVLLPAPYWTTYPEAIALAGGVPVAGAGRRASRLPGHGRAAGGGPHAADQGAAVLLAVQPDRRGLPAGAGRGDRPLGGRRRASGSSPTRSTSTWSTATPGTSRCRSSVPELADRCVVVNGVAKTYAMTGWRVGWMIGPADVDQGGDQPAVARDLATSPTSRRRAALAAVTGDLSAVARDARGLRPAAARRCVRLLSADPGRRPARSREGAFYVYPSVAGLLGRPTARADRRDLARELAAADAGRGRGRGRARRGVRHPGLLPAVLRPGRRRPGRGRPPDRARCSPATSGRQPGQGARAVLRRIGRRLGQPGAARLARSAG